MSKIALLLSVAALSVAGWSAWRTGCVPCQVQKAQDAARDAEARADAVASRADALEGRLAALENAPRPASPGPVAATAPTGRPGLSGSPTSASPTAPGDAPASAAPTMDDMAKRIAALEEARKSDEAAGRGPRTMWRGAPSGLLLSTDDAKRELELNDVQKSDFDRIVADAKRDLEDLRRTPDADGKTWEQVQKEALGDPAALLAGGGAARLDITKLMAFRNEPIPGRAETYGQADKRIRDDGKRRLRDALSTQQQEKFDKMTVDPMLGPGGAAAISVNFADATKAAPK